MELLNITGKTKSGEIRITKPIGALLISSDLKFDSLTNESITIFIERANGSNVQIATSVNLKDFILASVFGNSAINSTGGFSALCELSEYGAIILEENESIRFSLSNLKSASTYKVNGIEYPVLSDLLVRFDIKKVLSEESSRKFQVPQYETAVITGASAITEMNVTYANGTICKFTKEEIVALCFDVDPVVSVANGGAVSTPSVDNLVFPLIDAVEIEIYKDGGSVNLTLKNNDATENELIG